ncbi:EamA family transporter RarD [Microbulbifer hydrolyticus]|uniref:Chloramphenicol-sensitive protein RarD n=1 Tax=Microbulbifer hydrolyticus TaxID=48074 RepID=A0A6P1T7H9_9GAMM|nr:EamA family transporter RarD [Microbulbifer hydrolyticus]MBB5211244.1 chloramphenicol-sensitive protein RarD [Microbulbifer hydrolyticus]QHQ37987.1 EamA family transporter RarD [Microbulbifer hydrolyticus]
MQNQNSDTAAAGLLAGCGAYLIWGVAPLYFKLLGDLSAPEILAHRSIWSLLLALILLALLGKLRGLRAVFASRKTMLALLVSTALISTNWLIFIWSVTNDHLLDASLGYYINPLISVLLGVVVLGERLRPLQWIAVALAAVGIAYELWQFGSLPLVALGVATTFGFYGLVRKQTPVDSLTGLTVETLYLLPLAVGFLFWTTSPTSNLLDNSWQLNGLLLLAGPITLTPLLLFNIAARRLNLSTLGFLQYLGPTLMFFLAVLLFNEPFDKTKLVTFIFVWVALGFYSADALILRRKRRALRKKPL